MVINSLSFVDINTNRGFGVLGFWGFGAPKPQNPKTPKPQDLID